MRCVETPKYSIRSYQSEDEEQVLALLSHVLQGWAAYSDKRALWHWKHFANPFGPSHVMVACNERGDIIGTLAFMRVLLRREGKFVQSVKIVDSVTHPAYRRMGIALTLRQRLTEEARREGTLLVFNTPNKYTLPISLKIGNRPAGKIRPLIRVFDYRRFALGLGRRLLNKRVSQQSQPGDFFRKKPQPVERLLERREELERLLHRDEQYQNRCFRIHRSCEYLRWRYGEHPQTPYYTVCEEHRGELVGCAIFRADTYYSLRGVVLNELLLGTPEERLVSTLLKQIENILSVDYLLTYFSEGSLHRQILGRRGFLRLPWPAFVLTVGVWDPEIGEAPLNLDNWSLTPGDLEESWAWC